MPDDVPWAHFDMMAWNNASRPGRPEGGEAQAARAIFATIEKRIGKYRRTSCLLPDIRGRMRSGQASVRSLAYFRSYELQTSPARLSALLYRSARKTGEDACELVR